MPIIIGVKFKNRGKTYFFDPKNIQFAVGDGAIVETTRGLRIRRRSTCQYRC